MPSAPLFYQPLVHARVLSTPVGDTTVYDAHLKQSTLVNEAYQNPKFRPKMDAIMRGFEGLQAELPGSRSLDHIQFAFEETGYVANRVATTLRVHPNLFDTASPDQAAEMGANLVKEAQKELAEQPGMRAVGDTLEVAPDVSLALKAHWEGETLSPVDAAYVGVVAGREVQRSATPLEPDATHPTLQWLEDGSQHLLSMWPGAASKVASALGLTAEAAQVEQVVDGWRANMDQFDPKAAQPVASLSAILGAAGIGTDAAARDAALQVLQSTPLEGVPAGIAQSLVAHNELPPEASAYFAGRIVETGGTPGNVKGMLAELELMKRPVPVEPPPGTEPPGNEPAPPGGPTPEPPPDEEPRPPVDPPVDPEPDPGAGPKPPVDPPTDPDPDPGSGPKPPAEPSPGQEPEPGTKPDPDATPAPGSSGDGHGHDHDHAHGAGENPIAALMGDGDGGGTPMDPAEFERLLAEVRAEVDAEQGPHPVNDPTREA